MNSADKVKHYLRKVSPSFVGKIFYYLIPYRRTTVLANIKLAFGKDLNEREHVKLAQCFYTHLSRLIKEVIVLRFLDNDAISSRVELQGKEHLVSAYEKRKGVLILSGHFGNWELAPAGAAVKLHRAADTGQMHCIRKLLSNKFLEKLVFNRFNMAGIRVIPKEKTLRQTLKALAGGNSVVFVMDQHSSVGGEGILTEFFNKPVGTFRSLAKLAKKTGAPVVPVSSYRLASGRHVLKIHRELIFIEHQDAEEEQRLNTQRYNSFIEQTIIDHPDQWIWMHRRWKYFTRKQESQA